MAHGLLGLYVRGDQVIYRSGQWSKAIKVIYRSDQWSKAVKVIYRSGQWSTAIKVIYRYATATEAGALMTSQHSVVKPFNMTTGQVLFL